jgi:hypothetical protein
MIRVQGKVTRLNINGDVSMSTINNGIGDTTLIGRVGVVCRDCSGGGGGSVDKYVKNITVNDWYIQNGYYQLDVNHNLDSSHPLIDIVDSNDKIFVHETEILDNNNLVFKVPLDPDCRFEGEAILIKV